MQESSRYISVPKATLPAMPTLNSIQLRQNILQCLRTARFESSIRIPELWDFTSLQEVLERSPFFLVGDPDRPHRVAGNVVLGVHWPTLLKSLLSHMSNEKWIVPLIWSLRSVFTAKYPIMSNLLYRATATALALNWPHAPDNMSPLYLLKDAFPLRPQEEAVLEHFCARAANDPEIIEALQSNTASALQTFVMSSPDKGLKRYPFATPFFLNCEYKDYLFLDFTEFDTFNYKAHKCMFPTALDLPGDIFPYTYASKSFYHDFFSLSQLCPVDDAGWKLPEICPTGGYSEETFPEIGRRAAMSHNGVFTHKARDLCIVNFARVPLGFIFGPTSNYAKVSSSFAVGGKVYELLPLSLSTTDVFLRRSQAIQIAGYLNTKYEHSLVAVVGAKADKIINYYTSSGVWSEGERPCMFAFPLSVVEEKLRTLQTRTKRKAGRVKGVPIKPPTDFLVEPYSQVVQGVTLPLEVRFTHHCKNIYVQFLSLPFSEEWLTMLTRENEFAKVKDTHIKYWKPHTEPFLSLPFFRRLLRNDEYREKSCIAEPQRFLAWLESQAIDSRHFKRLCRLKKIQAKAASVWSPAEDDQIKLYLRVGMKKKQREALLDLLPNRTMKDVIHRAKVIREQLLAAGIKELKLYPRMRFIPGLNEKIKALP